MAGVWETLGAGALSFAETWWQNRQNEQAAGAQRNWEKWMYQNRYQMQVKDLIAAGLNPMLAYSQSPGGVPTGAASRAEKPDMINAINSTRMASAQEANIQQNTQKQMAEERNIDADTLLKTESMPPLLAAQVVQATSSAQHLNAMVDEVRATIPKIETQIKELEQKIKVDKSNVALNESYIEANKWLNGMRVAETYLINQRSRVEQMEGDILGPKAKAAHMHSAELGAVADNIGKIGSAAWKFMFPTLGGSGGSYPRHIE